MPTVPSTCVPFSSLSDEALIVPTAIGTGQFHFQDDISGPTPDPEMDDVVLVPVETGSAVTATDIDQPPAVSDNRFRPRMSLGSLVLHSPSSIVGTPFDLSPRFEYPFPDSNESDLPMSSSLPNSSSASSFSSLGVSSFGAMSSLPSASASRRRVEMKGFSPTHPKLHAHAREPPVPPSLAKKRRVMKESVPQVHKHRESLTRRLSLADRRSSIERRLSEETAVSDGGVEEKTPTQASVAKAVGGECDLAIGLKCPSEVTLFSHGSEPSSPLALPPSAEVLDKLSDHEDGPSAVIITHDTPRPDGPATISDELPPDLTRTSTPLVLETSALTSAPHTSDPDVSVPSDRDHAAAAITTTTTATTDS